MAAGVIGIFFAAIYLGFIFGLRELNLERESLQATQLINQKMELLRLYSWGRLGTTNFVPSSFQQTYYYPPGQTNAFVTYSGTIAVTGSGLTERYYNTLTKYVVTVTWRSSGKQYQRDMSTFVSQYGMQNAIYY